LKNKLFEALWVQLPVGQTLPKTNQAMYYHLISIDKMSKLQMHTITQSLTKSICVTQTEQDF